MEDRTVNIINKDDVVFVAIDFQEKLMPVMSEKEILEDKVTRLAACMNIFGVPKVVTQQYTRGIGETVPAVAAALGDFRPVDKTSFSCMKNEEFAAQLAASGRKTAVVCGIEAHICLMQTVFDLIAEGYRVVVPFDCMSSRDINDKIWAAERMEAAGAVLTTYEAIVYEMLGDSRAPEFKAVSGIVK